MFAKALILAGVVATTNAVKLTASVQLSAYAGVNLQTLSRTEVESLLKATEEENEEYKKCHPEKSYLSQEEKEARHEVWLQKKLDCEQMKAEDPDYHCGEGCGSVTDDMTSEEVDKKKGTKPPKQHKSEDIDKLDTKDHEMETEHEEMGPDGTVLAKTKQWCTLYNGLYPAAADYQFYYDNGNSNECQMGWNCQQFINWDSQWLEEMEQYNIDAYAAAGYDTQWISDLFDGDIANLRSQLRSQLQCQGETPQEQEQSSDDQTDGQGSNGHNQNEGSNAMCTSIDEETCLWGDRYVTPVKNQGSCGSCYAFSAIQILESAYAIEFGELFNLSEQQIVDCSDSWNGANGCNGGWPASLLQSLKTRGNAIVNSGDYEYTGTEQRCSNPSSSVHIRSSGTVHQAQQGSIESFKNALLHSPLGIAVDANQKFQSYSGGVLRNCPNGGINHAVNALGWTVMDGTPVMKVRNSWGANWGVEGNVYIAIDDAALAENGGLGPCAILHTGVYSKATSTN